MKNLNCHFVSRFLTKPWEFGQRRLHYYDVKKGRFCQQSSKVLFARQNINSRATEHRLDRLIETPLAAAIRDWNISKKDGPISISDWPAFRALMLIFPFQVVRTAMYPPPALDLPTICAWSDDKANEYALGMNELNSFVFFRPSAASPLFYTSLGYFLVPLPINHKGYLGALAIPLTDRLGVIKIPKEVDTELVRSFVSDPGGGLMSKFSIGTKADRVVVHPAYLEGRNLDEFGRELKRMQEENLICFKALSDLHVIKQAAFSEFGINPHEAMASRCHIDKKHR